MPFLAVAVVTLAKVLGVNSLVKEFGRPPSFGVICDSSTLVDPGATSSLVYWSTSGVFLVVVAWMIICHSLWLSLERRPTGQTLGRGARAGIFAVTVVLGYCAARNSWTRLPDWSLFILPIIDPVVQAIDAANMERLGYYEVMVGLEAIGWFMWWPLMWVCCLNSIRPKAKGTTADAERWFQVRTNRLRTVMTLAALWLAAMGVFERTRNAVTASFLSEGPQRERFQELAGATSWVDAVFFSGMIAALYISGVFVLKRQGRAMSLDDRISVLQGSTRRVVFDTVKLLLPVISGGFADIVLKTVD